MSRKITGGRAVRRLMTLLVGLGLGVSTLVVAAQPASAGPNHIATSGSTIAGEWDPGSISGDAVVNDGGPDAAWFE
jgi:hypothetical protein